MVFTLNEIDAARELSARGLDWQPRVGHFVFDAAKNCQRPSPFQEGVYFILNYDYFMRLLGGVEQFRREMIWLPTWEDCRVILMARGKSNDEVAKRLQESNAVARSSERLVLYNMILESLDHDQTTRPTQPAGQIHEQ